MDKRPPIERLPEDTWSRIKRNVFAQLDTEESQRPIFDPRNKRRWLPITAFVLSGAAAAVVVTLLVHHPAAIVAQPSHLTTQEAGTHISYGELALDVAAESELMVSGDDDHGRLLVLDRGAVTCELAPRHGRPPFVVQAGDARITVIGTRFLVTRHEQSATVFVEHGTVEVSSPSEHVFVSTGESWPKPAVETPIVDEPAAPAIPTKHHKPSAKLPGTETQAQTPTPTQTQTPLPPSPEQLYEHAAALESRNPDQAIAIYRLLATGDDAWAANALYAHGRLEADRHHRAEAQRLLGLYLSRFPQGVNARDARQLLDKLR
jgi:hypothetical protein